MVYFKLSFDKFLYFEHKSKYLWEQKKTLDGNKDFQITEKH